MRENVEHDEEVEKLLDEIPQITSYNLLHQHPHGYGGDDRQAIHGMYGMFDDDPFTHMTKYPCISSPVSGLSLLSDGSSSSPFSGRYPSSDNGSPTPLPLEELKSPMSSGSFNCPKSFCLDSKMPDLTVRKKDNGNLVDELELCSALRRMHFNNQHDKPCNVEDASIGMNGLPSCVCLDGNNPINDCKQEEYRNFKRAFLNRRGVESPFPSIPVSPVSPDSEAGVAFPGFPRGNKMAGLFGARHCSRRLETMMLQSNDFRSSIDSSACRGQLINNFCYGGNMAPELTASLSGHPIVDTSPHPHQNGMSLMRERNMSTFPNSPIRSNLRPYLSAKHLQQCNLPTSNARASPLSNTRIPQAGLDAITSEGSFIIQGEGLNYVISNGFDHPRGQSKGSLRETGYKKNLRKSEPEIQRQVLGNHVIHQVARTDCSFPSLSKCHSLAGARGYICLIAKDQQGCRFLQRMFDEGTPEDVQVIFNEIINHVVELMVNPFGNYLMQKLLDVCTEEQRMRIILMVTLERGQLVRISLNTHGTRVVQKLIETLKIRQQISLVVSALEPGFLELIKDLNGNHVIQRCLQFLSNEDNKFIFVAAAKYCIEIATHQHGCCVLQRCISHSSGEDRDRLIAEISANALLLAQDQYGNYVVQYILDLRNPYATACIISQFEGHYVHLSMEKFSSHVVEKCLAVFSGENRSRIICELLSAPHFEQLLQDPHANYVVQSALRNSAGHVHNALVEAIESHKAVSRNSPYSKKIFSQKLWKK
ncbi:putative pumilio homolog 7, chloroplastic [Neltuma alba]|uniref:putative pumilio homolog 7, chloroplastic n=1 Tax=Neltuma alba TaxID=207710 RepID=UPI0010A57911|nr:putative pumilio homolog 7, chloroplastic [Prosopis alba]XP_028753170.1 putative pumilio homolog 7, chloroplastic [Prosopis alba]